MSTRDIKLSVLDQSVVRQGATATEAVNETIETAKLCDRLGFTRFWVSEHHNTLLIAGSSPEVLMVKLADVTKRIRIGAGGVMLPNHSSLKVAENFRMLEVLFPGRIDLGIGRAPGGDPAASYMLNPANDNKDESFIRQLKELESFFTDSASSGLGRLLATPRASSRPPQWMLTSGGSSRLAGKMGMGLSIPRFINGNVSPRAIEIYKSSFVASQQFPTPQTSMGIFAVCAETEQKAALMRKAIEVVLLRMETGTLRGIMSNEAVKDYRFSMQELQRLPMHQKRIVSGTPKEVKTQLTALAHEFDIDEFIVTAITYSPEDRMRSFELMAEAFELGK